MEAIKFTCPECGQHLSLDDELAGATILCPSCQKEIVAPSSPATTRPIASRSEPTASGFFGFTKAALPFCGCILCLSVAVAVLFAAFRLTGPLHQLLTLKLEREKKTAEATDIASEFGLYFVVRALEEAGTIPPTEASMLANDSLQRLSKISDRTGKIAKYINDEILRRGRGILGQEHHTKSK